jgi:Tfp pilus assembly protein PilF
MRKSSSDEESSYKEGKYSPNTSLCVESLFNLLRHSECFEDALSVEEAIKEVWKAHSEVNIRWDLYDGLSHLLRGDRRTALNIYDKIIELDPGCTEAWNKKATCHYVSICFLINVFVKYFVWSLLKSNHQMLGDMANSEEAAKSALKADDRNFQALAGLGLVYNETKEYEKATHCFRKCLKTNPWSSVSSRLVSCLDTLKRLGKNPNEKF